MKTPKNSSDAKRQLEIGRRVYTTNCEYCHNTNGDGKNWIGMFIEPHPPDFTLYEWKKDIDQDRLISAVRNGIDNSAMLAWEDTLTMEEIRAVVYYIIYGLI